MTRKKSTPPRDDDNDDDVVDDGEPERKERVIHTRVPESLEAQLRQRAQDLGISVSNLVRNVLGHAFGLVGDVVADSHAVARAARGDRGDRAPRASSPSTTTGALEDVVGWQPLTLGKNAVCARCNGLLPKGSEAGTGVAEPGGARFVICRLCVRELTT
ncbi:MAG TPA: hypothetical protein VFQ53_39025 [Kofleriaceae bacterium]|nr:hypothetical protein [Kofleriaceae bacterium]